MGVKVKEKLKGSGVWWVFINHNRKRKAKRVGSKKAAKRVGEIIAARIKLGEPIEDKPELPTLEDYWKRFQNTYLQSAVAESTASSYKTNFTVHIIPFLGKLCLDEITPARMEEFITNLVTNKKLAKATIWTIMRELSRLFTHAMKHKLITENPASGLGNLYSQAPIRHEKIEPLIPEEIPLFLEAAKASMPSETKKVKVIRNGNVELQSIPGKRDWSLERYTLFLCAIHTGLRVGEQLALEWGDIDLRGKFLSVEEAMIAFTGKLFLPRQKSIGESTFPMNC